jgi:hypothetical protein
MHAQSRQLSEHCVTCLLAQNVGVATELLLLTTSNTLCTLAVEVFEAMHTYISIGAFSWNDVLPIV